jgi:hypothetical protein
VVDNAVDEAIRVRIHSGGSNESPV